MVLYPVAALGETTWCNDVPKVQIWFCITLFNLTVRKFSKNQIDLTSSFFIPSIFTTAAEEKCWIISIKFLKLDKKYNVT